MNAASRALMGESIAATLHSAGAPELPDHHIYRIKQETHSDHVVRVEVRRLNDRVGSTCLAWSTFSLRDGGTAVDAVVRACTEAHAEAFPNGAVA
ncbi:hypothetical protein OG474_09810 [Kribbella sp. NBC_01505]|uniref:hypothetical protein n=1 Tax=Kribbella sp. NBC_01505 TaxID=2903580 RepID=UPI00386598E1